jgi:hypothetical protein
METSFQFIQLSIHPRNQQRRFCPLFGKDVGWCALPTPPNMNTTHFFKELVRLQWMSQYFDYVRVNYPHISGLPHALTLIVVLPNPP